MNLRSEKQNGIGFETSEICMIIALIQESANGFTTKIFKTETF
jgi:hypothetical protein